MSDGEMFALYVISVALGAGVAWYILKLQTRIWDLSFKVRMLRTQITFWHVYDGLKEPANRARFKEVFIKPPEALDAPEVDW